MPASISRADLAAAFGDKADHGNGADIRIAMSENGFTVWGVSDFNALVLFNVPENATSFTHDAFVEAGRTVTGRIVGPDDKPVTGVMAFGLRASASDYLQKDTFYAQSAEPKRDSQARLPARQEGARRRPQGSRRREGPLDRPPQALRRGDGPIRKRRRRTDRQPGFRVQRVPERPHADEDRSQRAISRGGSCPGRELRGTSPDQPASALLSDLFWPVHGQVRRGQRPGPGKN